MTNYTIEFIKMSEDSFIKTGVPVTIQSAVKYNM